VLYPSLRLGYLVVPPSLVDAFAAMRAIAAGPPPLVEQAVLAAFITEGHFGRHIRRMRMLYQRRRTVMIEAAKAELEGLLEIHAADAGLHAVGWLSHEMDDEEVCARAAQGGITTIALSSLYQGAAPRPGLVLGFAAFDDETIWHGMCILARVLSKGPRLRSNSIKRTAG
jgi:GntR family transcriptional regulator / MocR family aminotransferase